MYRYTVCMADPLEALKRATRRYRKTEAAHEAARTEAIYQVVEALRAGVRPTDVTNASPFEAAYVRRLARKNGINPTTKGVTSPQTQGAECASPDTGITEPTSSSPTS